MATLTNTKIKDTYDGLLKTTDNDVIGASEKVITDGLGNASVLSIGTGSASFSTDIEVNTLTIGLGSGSIATNTALGSDALLSNTSGSGNVSVGQGSMRSNTTGLGNVAVGKDSLRNNTAGYYNIAVGYESLLTNTTGSYNSALGISALGDNTTGSYNTALGSITLDVNTEGNHNVAVGYRSLAFNTTGQKNVAVGSQALSTQTIGSFSTAVGYEALMSQTTGSNNTAVGYASMRTNTTGAYNTAIGIGSLYDNTEGQNNTAVGYNSANSNTTGLYNTALGSAALYANETGGSNTALGYFALRNNTGASNTAIGSGAGDTNTTGSNNIYIGYDAVGSAADNDNEIVIGASTTGNGSNTATYGNASITQHHFTAGQVNVSGNLAVDTNTLYVDAANNRVGIGTSSLGANKFTVLNNGDTSDVKISSDTLALLQLEDSGLSKTYNIEIGRSGTSGDLTFRSSEGEKVRFTESGNVGIGTQTVNATYSPKLEVASTASDGTGGLLIGSYLPTLTFYDYSGGATIGQIQQDGTGLVFKNNASERMRIDSSGNVTIRDGKKLILNRPDNAIDSELSTNSAGTLILNSRNGEGFDFQNGGTGAMRIDSSGNVTNTSSGDFANFMVAPDANNSGIYFPRGGNNYYGGFERIGTDLRFLSGGAGEAMRIDSSGNVGIGTSSPDYPLHIVGTNGIIASMSNDSVNSNKGARYMAGAYTGNLATFALIDGTSGNNVITIGGGTGAGEPSTEIRFNTGSAGTLGSGTERMRITSGGVLAVGKSTSLGVENAGLYVAPNDFMSYTNTSTDTGDRCVIFNRQSAVGTVVDFRTGNSTKGSITISSSAVAYNTTSDYRLKENVVEMTGALDRVDALKPSRFNFIADPEKTVDGFLAHEVAEVVPEAISGEKDAVDEEGNPIYQGIDQSKIVPLLVGAIKELRAEIETLKSQLS